jgi:tyrosine-protein kinase Etk/Wzc
MAPKNSKKQALENKFDLRKEINRFSKHWPWFLLSIILCVSLGYFYIKYSTPVYMATASIIINTEGNNGGAAVDEGLGSLIGLRATDLTNEIGILQSRNLMKEVVKSLDLHVQFFREDKIPAIELYEDVPFSLQILQLDDQKLKDMKGAEFEVLGKNNVFIIKDLKTQKIVKAEAGSPVGLPFGDVVFNTHDSRGELIKFPPVTVRFEHIEKVATKYRKKIILNQVNKSSGLMELSLQDPVKQKASDILDQLVLEFNRNAIEKKNLLAGNTAKFINERLNIINGELDSVETGKEIFKERNQLTDLDVQSTMFLQNANDYNKRHQEVGTQLELVRAMLEYISSSSKAELLPTNLGISESGVNQQINEYNTLVLERNRILGGSGEKNPVVIRLNSQIDQIKGNIVQSLNNVRSNLLIGKEDLDRQSSSIGAKIYSVPSKEREFRGIERQQNIKESLYLFMLQKREENSLALAVTEPKAQIIDRAFTTAGPVSPNIPNIYLGSFIMGMFIPFSVIYVRNILDNKIRRREDIENITREIAIAGLLPRVGRNKSLIQENDRSVLAEAFRILITNLQYLLVNSRDKNKGLVLLISSTITGEGKTFTAVNLAITLANTGKKVLLMGADLRNPQLHVYEKDWSKKPGLSDYLIHENVDLEDILTSSKLHTRLDIIEAGSIPPNPYELFKQEGIGVLFSLLEKQYDYIVIDTAPCMLVADTFLITKYADLILYMVRADYTEKDLLEFAVDSKESGKLPNVCFVLNGLKNKNLGYGNKYGYGYSKTEKSWRKKRRLALEPSYR